MQSLFCLVLLNRSHSKGVIASPNFSTLINFPQASQTIIRMLGTGIIISPLGCIKYHNITINNGIIRYIVIFIIHILHGHNMS